MIYCVFGLIVTLFGFSRDCQLVLLKWGAAYNQNHAKSWTFCKFKITLYKLRQKSQSSCQQPSLNNPTTLGVEPVTHYHVFGALLPKNVSDSITSIPDICGWRYAYDMNLIFLTIRSLRCSVSEMMSINATFEVVYIFDESGNPRQPPAFMRDVDWLNTDDIYPSTIGGQSRFWKREYLKACETIHSCPRNISITWSLFSNVVDFVYTVGNYWYGTNMSCFCRFRCA